jgi:hypothetical protein
LETTIPISCYVSEEKEAIRNKPVYCSQGAFIHKKECNKTGSLSVCGTEPCPKLLKVVFIIKNLILTEINPFSFLRAV